MTATTRPTRSTLFRIATGALFAVLAAGSAQAAPDDLERVQVSGRRPGEIPRTDVRATCPGVDQVLFDRLARAQFREGQEGVSTVSFRMNGNVISEVRERGPAVYRAPLRTAIRSLQCQGAPKDTLYVMQVSFRNQESSGDMNERVAMIEMAPPAAGSVAVAASAADGR